MKERRNLNILIGIDPALNSNGGIFETYLLWIRTIFVKFIMNLRSLAYVIIHL